MREPILRADVYVRKTEIIVAVLKRTSLGRTIMTDQVVRLPRDVDATTLGAAVSDALERHQHGVPELEDPR